MFLLPHLLPVGYDELAWTNDKGRKNPATVNIKGYSPRILVKNIDGGHELVVTDRAGSKTIQVMDGVDGEQENHFPDLGRPQLGRAE